MMHVFKDPNLLIEILEKPNPLVSSYEINIALEKSIRNRHYHISELLLIKGAILSNYDLMYQVITENCTNIANHVLSHTDIVVIYKLFHQYFEIMSEEMILAFLPYICTSYILSYVMKRATEKKYSCVIQYLKRRGID